MENDVFKKAQPPNRETDESYVSAEAPASGAQASCQFAG